MIKKSNVQHFIISGAPLIGEGNIVDTKAILSVLSGAGIPCTGFYPNGPLVWLGRNFHIRMSMSTGRTMQYALNSDTRRSSFMVRPLKWELRRSIKKAHEDYPHATCFITSQSMMAEASAGSPNDISTIVASSDVSGKYTRDSAISDRQKKITHLVWNEEAFHLYKEILNLKDVHLIMPVDPIQAFKPTGKSDLPFQWALDEPKLCFVKLSGSGGDPGLVNAAILSLWEKSHVKSIVFPGTEKTQRRLVKTVNENIKAYSSLDASVFYNHARLMISHEHMLLAYPSEQVKHVAILTQTNICPKVVWLPPRGRHEVGNLAWAIQRGYSGTVCIPAAYHSLLKMSLINLGVSPPLIECVEPEMLSAQHFRPSPVFENETDAVPLENIIRKVANTR